MLQTLNNLKLSAANLTIAIIESEQKNTDASDLRLRLRYVRMMIKTLDSVYNSSIVDTERFNRLSQYVTYLVGSYITIPGSSSSISANIVSQPENNLPAYLSGGYESVVINSITNALERTDIISAINSLIANNANGYLTTIAGIAAGGDLSGAFPNPTVAKFNGQLPSYYLNYNNLTNIPAPLDLSGYLTSSTAATTYYPLSSNPAGYLTGITGSQVNSALGYAPENPANKGIANGYVPLNNSIKIDAAYLPSYVSDIVTASSFSALPTTGTAGFLYITTDTNYEYRWNVGTNAYIRLVASPGTTDALAEGVSNLYYTNARAIAAQLTGYTSGAGTVASTDSVLQAIQKLNGNIAGNTSNFANYGALSGNNSWTGSNTWSVQANFATVVISDSHVLSFKSGSFVGQIQPSLLTASRSYTLPDKTGTFAMANDNVSEFANDAGYLTSGTGVTGGVINWPGTIFTSPTTGTYSGGTLTFAPILANQAINKVFAGPTSGSSGNPTWRSLVANDIPDLSATYLSLATGGNVLGNIFISNTSPSYQYNSTSAGTDQKRWDSYASSGGIMNFRLISDDQLHANNWLTVTRTGYASANAAFLGSVSSTYFISGTISDAVSTGVDNTPYNFLGGGSGYWGIRTGTDDSFNLDTYHGGVPINVLKINQAGLVTIGSSNPIILSPGTYNTLSLNGSSTSPIIGIIGGGPGDANMYINTGTGGDVVFRNGATNTEIGRIKNGGIFSGSLFTATNIYGTSATPTVSVTSGGGAGTGATASITGTNTSGTVTFTVGSSPGIGSLFNITMSGSFAFPNFANGIAQLNSTSVTPIPVGASFTTNASSTVLQVQIAGAALTAGSTYKINYICIGY